MESMVREDSQGIEILGQRIVCPVVISTYGSMKSLFREYEVDEIDFYLDDYLYKLNKNIDQDLVNLLNISPFPYKLKAAQKMIVNLKKYLVKRESKK